MDYDFKSDTTQEKQTKKTTKPSQKKNIAGFDQKPTPAFIGASWVALFTGVISYCIGLWYSDMMLNERGYYFTILLFGLFLKIFIDLCFGFLLYFSTVATVFIYKIDSSTTI